MNDQEAYEAGITKLGLYIRVFRPQYESGPIDLRHDRAFAWRVLEAFVRKTNKYPELNGRSLADALYATVVALGRSAS